MTWRDHCKKHAEGDNELIKLLNELDENGYWNGNELSDKHAEKLKELGNKADFIGLGSKDIRECWLAHLEHHFNANKIESDFYNRAKKYLEDQSAFDEFMSPESETFEVKHWANALGIEGEKLKEFELDCVELYHLVDAPPVKDQYMEENRAVIQITQDKYGKWQSKIDLYYDELDTIMAEIDFTSLGTEEGRDIKDMADNFFNEEYALYQRVGEELSNQLSKGRSIEKLMSSILRDTRDYIKEFVQERKDKRKEDRRLYRVKDFVDENQIREFERQIVKIMDKDKKARFITFKQLMRK